MVQSDLDSKLNQTKAIALEDIRVVQDFPGVFLEELLGMPPDHDIEFLIELLPMRVKLRWLEPTRHKRGLLGGCDAHAGGETSVGMLQTR
jgi:hypothetical protein